jgi:mono/diheme cytochrome c family protein
MNTRAIAAFALSALALTQPVAAAGPPEDAGIIERGRYLVRIGGCNDCHTPGYLQSNGEVSEAQWLTGSVVGFQGPWGTTYPANLRHTALSLTEDQWLARAREPMRPPMPWFNLRAMTDEDLVAMYRYIVQLGPAGEPAPAAAAPGVEVATPYFDFTPKNLPKVAGR